MPSASCCTSCADLGDRRQAARGDHRGLDLARQPHGRLDVDSGEHAVAADVGVDDALDAVVLELAREVDDVVAGHLRPAVGGHLAVAGVEADDDVPRKRRAGVVQEAGILHRRGADDHVADAVVEVALDGVEVADAAAQLHRDLLADHADDFADRELVLRLAGHGAVQVDQVQPLRAQLQPVLRHCRRVLGEHGDRLHVALLQAHAMAVLDVDGRNDLHGGQRAVRRVRRARSRRRNSAIAGVRPAGSSPDGTGWRRY